MINKLKNKTYRFLRWTEKWTKTDMIYLANGGFWLSLIQFFATISGFLTSLAFANLLPIEIYGQYKYILSIITILSIPTLNQMNVAIIQSVANGHEGTLGLAIKTKIKYGLLGGVASIILAGYYYLNNNNNFTILFLILAPFIPLMNSFSVYGALLKGKKDFKSVTKYNLISNIISTAILILTVFYTNNLTLIILSVFISRNIINFIIYRITKKKYTENKKIDYEAINYGKFLSFTGILTSISSNIDKILLWHFLGPGQLAIYSFASAPIKQIRPIIANNLNELSLPKFSNTPIETIKKNLPKKIFKLILIILPISIIYYFLIPFFFNFFYPQYTEAIKYSQILGFTLLIYPSILLNTLFHAKKKKKNILLFKTIFPSLSIISLFILVPFYGIMGVIMNIFIMGTIRTIYLLIYLLKKNA